jgi:hypothetical protein
MMRKIGIFLLLCIKGVLFVPAACAAAAFKPLVTYAVPAHDFFIIYLNVLLGAAFAVLYGRGLEGGSHFIIKVKAVR